ncbi:unnamed protein product, partial [Fusarium langsethiae]
EPNSVTSSGDLPVMKGESGLNAVGQNKDNMITPVSASEVVALVVGKAGPAGVGSGSAPASDSGSDKVVETTPVASVTTPEATPVSAPSQEAAPQDDYEQSPPVAAEQDCDGEPVTKAPEPTVVADCDEEPQYSGSESKPVVTQAAASGTQADCDEEPNYDSEYASEPVTPKETESATKPVAPK